MAVSWRREGRPNLVTKPWNVLTVNEKDTQKTYLVKSIFKEDGYHVMLSDTCSVWEETISSTKVNERLRDLNPSVEAPLSVLQSTLRSHLETQNETAIYEVDIPSEFEGATAGPDFFILSVRTTMASLPLEWHFQCNRSSPNKLSEHLVLPLLAMVGELGRRQQHLTQLLSKKDKELQDFSEQGYTVTRKYLKTVPFTFSAFENEMITSSNFETTACRDVQILAAAASQRLYRDVTMVRRWSQDETNAAAVQSEAAEEGGVETTGTWAAKIPASLLPTVPVASHSQTASLAAVTSPVKRPAPPLDDSPSKEKTELSRREALKEKLQKDKNKAKKKRKLM